MRDELKNEAEGGWAKSALLNEYEEKSRKDIHTIKAAIEKIYSVLVSYDTVAVEAAQNGGINRRDAKSESVLLNEVELKVNLEKCENKIEEDAALLVRADQAFAKAEVCPYEYAYAKLKAVFSHKIGSLVSVSHFNFHLVVRVYVHVSVLSGVDRSCKHG